MLASFTHFLPLAAITRKRMLPANGQVRVAVGQNVMATDVVAVCIMGCKYQVIDVAYQLRVSPREAAALIKVNKDQNLSNNQVIAETSGFLGREVLSPGEGRVAMIGGGKLVIESGGTTFNLMAGLSGIVTDIIPERGVIIRGSGSLIQGIWGNGRIDVGVLMSAMDRPDDIFEPGRLDVSIRNSIILGGHVDNPAVLKNAIDLPVRGLVVSSIIPALLPEMARAPFPVMVIDGFGRKPMNSNAFKLLSTNIRREVCLNAAIFDRFKGERPEVVIPLPVSSEPSELREVGIFEPNQMVRVLSLTGPAGIGTLIKISPAPTILPNGLRVRTAEVQLNSGQQITAPLTNLEVLG